MWALSGPHTTRRRRQNIESACLVNLLWQDYEHCLHARNIGLLQFVTVFLHNSDESVFSVPSMLLSNVVSFDAFSLQKWGAPTWVIRDNANEDQRSQ